jgi:hypothetical protein
LAAVVRAVVFFFAAVFLAELFLAATFLRVGFFVAEGGVPCRPELRPGSAAAVPVSMIDAVAPDTGSILSGSSICLITGASATT